MHNINQLPDVALRAILAHLPMSDLLQAGNVCQRWRHLLPGVACNRRQLAIMLGEGSRSLLSRSAFAIEHVDELQNDDSHIHGIKSQIVKIVPDESLDFDWLDNDSVELLIRLLPNVETLIVSIDRVPPVMSRGIKSWKQTSNLISQLIRLLTTWRPCLITLRLYIHLTDIGAYKTLIETEMLRLLAAINLLGRLRHLTLESHNDMRMSNEQLSLYMPVLGWIHELNFGFNGISRLYDSLSRFAIPNPSLTRIALTQITYLDISATFFQQSNFPAEKFQHFPHLTFMTSSGRFASFCRRFRQLESISLVVYQLSDLYEMCRHLTSCQCLVNLSLNMTVFNFHDDVMFDDEEEEAVDQADAVANDQEEEEAVAQRRHRPPVVEPPVLESVRILNISAHTNTHEALYPIDWVTMFPNLEILHFFYHVLPCDDCRNIGLVDAQHEEQEEEEAEEELAPNLDAEPENRLEMDDAVEPMNPDHQNPPNVIINNPELARQERERVRTECLHQNLRPWSASPKLQIIHTVAYNADYSQKERKRWTKESIQ